MSSVLAAVFLTSMKLVVGLLTRSLGILSEAAHSGLDLVAAAITYGAVRTSDRAPDQEHPYGHGKVENLSALVETLLLLITCVWIIYEAIQRLFFKTVHVEVSIWSFLVMGTSIVVDISRSRMLKRMAIKHHSQALEADALHFSTDVWSSSVVILGLIGVALAEWLKGNSAIWAERLHSADAIAALGVSGIVIYVSVQLGKRTIAGLLDSAPRGMMEQIEGSVAQIEGVSQVTRVRVRQSGPAAFADVTLGVSRNASFEEAHRIATEAENRIRELFPRTDVVVHVDPARVEEQSLLERIWSVAARQGVAVHSIRAHDVRDRLNIEMHVEVPDDLTLGEAHTRVTQFEIALRKELPDLGEVVTHIEPVGNRETYRAAVRTRSEEVHAAVLEVSGQVPGVEDCHHIQVYREGENLLVSFHCHVDPALPIADAHRLTEQFESLLRARLPDLGWAVIHLEPEGVVDSRELQ